MGSRLPLGALVKPWTRPILWDVALGPEQPEFHGSVLRCEKGWQAPRAHTYLRQTRPQRSQGVLWGSSES